MLKFVIAIGFQLLLFFSVELSAAIGFSNGMGPLFPFLLVLIGNSSPYLMSLSIYI